RTGVERGTDWTSASVIVDANGWPVALADLDRSAEETVTADIELSESRNKRLSDFSDVFADRRTDLYSAPGDNARRPAESDNSEDTVRSEALKPVDDDVITAVLEHDRLRHRIQIDRCGPPVRTPWRGLAPGPLLVRRQLRPDHPRRRIHRPDDGIEPGMVRPRDRPRSGGRNLLHRLPRQPGSDDGPGPDDPISGPVRQPRGAAALHRNGLRLHRFPRLRYDPRHPGHRDLPRGDMVLVSGHHRRVDPHRRGRSRSSPPDPTMDDLHPHRRVHRHHRLRVHSSADSGH